MNNIKQFGALPPKDQEWMVGKTMGVIECVRFALQMMLMQNLSFATTKKIQKLIEDWKSGKRSDFVYPPTEQEIIKLSELED